jgi:hypothetical protein
MISAAIRRHANEASGTWRSHPFAICGRYIATESFSGFPDSNFETGETYVLERVEYSIDYFSTIFTFHKRGYIAPLYWWWYDDEPDRLCQERFRRLL